MFGIPMPYVAIGVFVLAVASYFTGHHYGWAERDAEMQLEIAKKDAEAREIEHVMTGKINEHNAKLMEANDALEKESSALQRAIRAGRVRLPAPSCVQASPSATPASADSPEARGESDTATLEAIAAIVADGDRAINQLNACVDAYNAVREQINGVGRD
jgi:hypothetical protein